MFEVERREEGQIDARADFPKAMELLETLQDDGYCVLV